MKILVRLGVLLFIGGVALFLLAIALYPDQPQVPALGAVAIGTVCAPIIGGLAVAGWVYLPDLLPDRPKRLDKRDAERAARQDRIDRMERELGIDA